ncbi:MAG: glycosyltransferase family 4 protein [Gammaproteobacteria bacterium]|nr:glycosyltransferase family 4 protein [Gammaproteobacteria bacterium]MCW9006248.1 glycosyltransferase family 4 protein [Gammaproteobacteria bacterium]
MNVLYIWDADYPWDIRVEKICEALKNEGHDVHIASRNLKKNEVYEEINGVKIHRIKSWRNDKLNYFMSFPLFFSPVWKVFLDKIINKHKVDIVIVRDLPMAIAGIWAGKRFGIPVIFDMAEDYVSMIRDIWKLRKYQGLNLIVRNPYLAKYVERYSFEHMDHVLVVIEDAVRVVTNGGGESNKVTIVSNTPRLSDFKDDLNFTSNNIDIINKHFSLIYTGGIQMGRGIHTVLDAIPDIVLEIPDFLFVIVGDGYAREKLKKMVTDKGLDEYVLWVGWVDHSELFSYIKACNIGIIPHLVTEHVETTIPNKIFDYMGCGIPVISSDATPMKTILDSEKCGITFKGGDSKDVVRAISELYKSTFDYGSNGKRAIKERYNWDKDVEKLLGVINKYKSNNH